ncbi:MAG: hypothetical protein KatS3mg108_1544 [Isosphaeraceae bacterium]|nr:MAG: hypothetical protein KatS3mg108_1544 [Isosphaeraceae bacterium]
MHRRVFLQSALGSSALVSLGATAVPAFLGRSALAARGRGNTDRVLVVIQLLGGNDGLNTVIPYQQDGYARARRLLRIPASQLVRIADGIGLHPGLTRLGELIEGGRLAIVQGVGYPNPDRSHFRSMEIWETARTETGPAALETGWLGRLQDEQVAGGWGPALHVGGRQTPLALRARRSEAVSLEDLDALALRPEVRQTVGGSALEDESVLSFVRRTALAAQAASERLAAAAKPGTEGKGYPATGLGRRLELVARLIRSDFGTRVFYTTLDGFDTHANQLGAHAALLTELGDALAAFDADLKATGEADRTAVLVFSEFGRRVAENASAGTDHGAAAPVFVVGPLARCGLVGAHPSLEDLDDGDLRHHTDFRRIYAAVLSDWLGTPAEAVLGPGFDPLELFRA